MRKSDRFEQGNSEQGSAEQGSSEQGSSEQGDSIQANENDERLSGVRSRQIEALRAHQMRNRWWLSLALWLTVGLPSLWLLRYEFQELREYFTWAAVRAMLAFNRLAALGLGICFGLTVAFLYTESRHILFGLSKTEEQQLSDRLNKIQSQGPSHPQWKLIAPDQTAADQNL